MKNPPAPLYTAPLLNLRQRLVEAVDSGLERRNSLAIVFFRADDIGVPSRLFRQMMHLFQKQAVPLNLAVVPAWLTNSRWRQLHALAGDSGLFCWHQHGWRHANHETREKKGEFGDSRKRPSLQQDLLRGRLRLAALMGDHFLPVFTPPWNRCGTVTLSLLQEHGYRGISRNAGALPSPPSSLQDISINVDLHTRREATGEAAFNALLRELEDAVASGVAGIMLHHQRMNKYAFVLLEQLMQVSRSHPGLVCRGFTDILE